MANEKKDSNTPIEQTSAFQEALAKAVKEALPVMAGVIVQAQEAAKMQNFANSEAHRPTGERCGECQQLLPAGCKQGEHKHKEVVLYPQNPHYGEWFQGCFINGIRYLSDGPNHKVIVPFEANVEKILRDWENNEDALRHGKVTSRRSGNLSGVSGHNPNQVL